MYSLRVPFRLPHGQRISPDQQHRSIDKLTFTLSWDGQYHVLQVDGFQSENDANKYLQSLQTSIAWLLIDRDISAEVSLTSQDIKYTENPVHAAQNLSKSLGVNIDSPVDGILHGEQAAVFKTEKIMRICTFSAGIAHVMLSAEIALDLILQGSEFPGSLKLNSDKKLLVALQLYGAFFAETSTNARFLTLIMALEALATPAQRAPAALELINGWAADVEARLARTDLEYEDAEDLKSLRSQLIYQRESSIRSQIRQLITTTLQADDDVSEQKRVAMRLYDLRSKLVHEGTVDPQSLDKSTLEAKSLVLRVLRNRFRDLVQA